MFCKQNNQITWLSIKYLKKLDYQRTWQSRPDVCLIIKGFDNQAPKLHDQINQYPPKSLISYLVIEEHRTASSLSWTPNWGTLCHCLNDCFHNLFRCKAWRITLSDCNHTAGKCCEKWARMYASVPLAFAPRSDCQVILTLLNQKGTIYFMYFGTQWLLSVLQY